MRDSGRTAIMTSERSHPLRRWLLAAALAAGVNGLAPSSASADWIGCELQGSGGDISFDGAPRSMRGCRVYYWGWGVYLYECPEGVWQCLYDY
jgi:hypothetical protein